MPASFAFKAMDEIGTGKPSGWFDLVKLDGVEPTQAQEALKATILDAQTRIASLHDSPKLGASLASLGEFAKAALVNAPEPPQDGDDRIKKILTDAGLGAGPQTTTETAASEINRTSSADGWTVQSVPEGEFFRLKLLPPKSPSIASPEQMSLAAGIIRVERQLNNVFSEDQLKTARLIRWLKPHPLQAATRRGCFERLAQLAEIGLGSNYSQVTYATATLADLEIGIFEAAGYATRRWYLIKCAIYTGVIAFISLIFYSEFVCKYLFDILRPTTCQSYRGFFLVLAGSMLGMWLSIASGRVATTLQELEQVIVDPLGPGLRVFFVLNVAFAGIVLLSSGLVELKIGTFEIKNLGNVTDDAGPTSRVMVTLLIGILFGFSEKSLPTVFANRAREFVGSLGPKTPPQPTGTGTGKQASGTGT